MARNQWTLALILICIPILATVITAFRVRDLPKTAYETERDLKVDLKKQICDDCEVNELKVGQKLQSVKIESAKRSYEDLKKATREKLQSASQRTSETKSSFKIKHVSDEDDDDDSDDDFVESEIGLKRQGKASKSVKNTQGLKLELRTKPSAYTFDSEDDDDDDDDDDKRGKKDEKLEKSSKEFEDKKVEINPRDSIKELKSVRSLKQIEDDDDDDEDDDDDDDDEGESGDGGNKNNNKGNLERKSKLDKISEGIKDRKLDRLKEFDEEPKTKKPSLKISFDDDDDDDDDDDEDTDSDDTDEEKESVKKEVPVILQKKQASSQPEPSKKDLKANDKSTVKETKKPLSINKDAKLDDKPKKVLKTDESVKEATPIKNPDPIKKEMKPDKKPETKLDSKQTSKQTKHEPIPVIKKEEKIESKDMEEKKKEQTKLEKETVKTKPQEHKETKPSADSKQTQKKPEPEKKKDDKTVKPVEKTKPEPERKKHFDKKEKPSKESSIESKESLSKTESHLKHVSDALHRRNLLLSEFEDFYAFFPTFAPNFSRIHNPECRRHGQIVLRQLRGTKLWAFSMLDATAKIPSGILQGNGIQLGDFDQCLASRARVQLESGNVVKVQGKYCLASLDVKAEHPELELPVHLALAKNLLKSRIDDPGHFVPRFSTLSWGVCVPAACDPEDVEVVIKDALKHYQHTSGLVVRVKVDPSDCHEHDGGEWWEDWLELPTLLTLSFYGVIVLLVFVATLQDYFASRKSEEDQGNAESDDNDESEQKEGEDSTEEEPAPKPSKDGVLSAFSLYRTVNKLLAPGTDDEIACIHGIRGLATLALLVAHKFLPLAVMPYTNRLKITETVSSPLWSWCRAGWMYTDCFLLLSGALLAHRISADRDTGALRRLFSRYLRLTPALLAVVLFYAYVWDNIASGPMWGTLVSKNVEVCQEGWWWNLLYVQNYFGFEEMCAPQTHQLALDFQLTILGSALVWAINSELMGARFLIPAIHAISAYSRYTTVQEHRLTMLAYHGASVSQLYRTARLSYTSTLHRTTPYLIGLSLGLALKNSSRHGKILLTIGWLNSTALWWAVWWAGSDAGSTTYRYSATFAAQYAAFAPFASGLAIAWVIYIVHNGHCEWVSNFLCCRFLVLTSRLSYALYLCQFIVFLTIAGTVRTSSEFSLMTLIDVQEVIIILLSSTILTLTFVIPMQSLHKLFTFSAKREAATEGGKTAEETSEEKTEEIEPVENPDPKIEEIEKVIEVPPLRRQHLVAHREVLEEIPEAEIEFEMQRQKNEGLEEILEEEEDEGAEEEEEERPNEDDDLEIIEEEEGGEDDIWENRDEYQPSRLYRRNDDDDDGDLDEWELTTSGTGRTGAQYYRYSR